MRSNRLPLASALLGLVCGCTSGPETAGSFPGQQGAVAEIFAQNPTSLGLWAGEAEQFRLQVLLSEVVEGPDGSVTLKRHGFRLNEEYFYPASAIKLCGAVAALQLLNGIEGADMWTPLVYWPLFEGEVLEDRDESNLDGGVINVAHEIRKLCLVSDNQAYNRLYELVGHAELNRAMWALGLKSAVLNHRLADQTLSPTEQLRTPRVDLLTPSGALTIPERTSRLELDSRGLPGVRVGEAYLVDGVLVEEPLDFASKNRMSLQDLQDLLVKIVRPDIDLGSPALELSPEQLEFLRAALGQFPRESRNPVYDPEQYPDDSMKLFLPGIERVLPESEVRIYNKIGRAYGFTVENAYVVDVRGGRGFFLSAVLYSNSNGVLNDGDYDYGYLSDPFFGNLAEAVARRLWGEPL